MSLPRLLTLLLATTLVAASCGSGTDAEPVVDALDAGDAPTSTAAVTTTEATTTTAAEPVAAAPQDLGAKPTVVTPGGEPPVELVIRDLVVGDGDEAVAGSLVQVHYVGIRYSDGGQFDASWDRGEPFEFELGAGFVIPGWDQGVSGMRVGGRRQLTIPSDLAYGQQGAGDAIPPGEALIFVVDLVAIVPAFPVPEVADDGSVVIPNQGGDFEGNLPWSTEAAGPGLFVGDEISPTFPTDEGVELFVLFNLEGVAAPADASVTSATLTSRAMQTAGTPFDDLGALTAAPVAYTEFPPFGPEREPVGDATPCEPILDERRLTCDVTDAVVRYLEDGADRGGFRLRFDEPSDADGEADVAVFFFRDPNLNERGIFTLEISFG